MSALRDTLALMAAMAMVGTTLSPTALLAQEWHLGAQGGRIRSAIDPNAAATETFAAGLRFDAPSTALRFTGGIPTSDAEPLWGSLAAWQRLAVGNRRGAMFGVDMSGTAFLSHDRSSSLLPGGGGPLDPPRPPTTVDRSGTAVAGQLLPLVGYRTPAVQVQARAGVSHFRARLGGEVDRTVRLADLQLTWQPSTAVALVPTVRYYRGPDEPGTTYIGVTALAATSRIRLSASAGSWSGVPSDGMPWSVAARAELVPRVALEFSARHDAFDPLYMQLPQTSWSAGLTVQLAGRRGPAPLPVPATYAGGVATIELPVAKARGEVMIAGDFTHWKPVPMHREGRVWRLSQRLAPGVYHYAFVTPSGEWYVPDDLPGRRDDGMGGHLAVLVVE